MQSSTMARRLRLWLRTFVAAALGAGLLVTGGCGKREPAADEGAVAGEVVPGGTAVVALAGDPDVLNSLIRTSAYAGMILAELQDGLAELDEDLVWKPRIADSWLLAADRMSITYTLRPWVWSDGEALTARDVVSSFALFRDDRVASQMGDFYSDVAGVTAPDSATVIYHFRRAVPDPVTRTIHAILPEHLTRDLDPARVREWPLNRRPLSSGDFVLHRWDHNRSLILSRNDRYPGPAAYLERVVFRILPEESARLVALETGEVDLVDGIPPQTARRWRRTQPEIRIHETGGRQFYYVLWNLANPKLADAATRRALSMAMDRDRLIETLVLGFGEPAASPIPPAMWNHAADLPYLGRDPAEARRLLATAGWRDEDGDGVLERDGRRLRISVLTKQGDPVRENGVLILRDNLREVGVELEPLILEHATGLARLREGAFEAYLGRFNANLYGDPSGLVDSRATDRYNYGAYANATVDSLLDVALATLDRDAARPIWRRLQEVLMLDPPAAYLFYPEKLVGVRDRLQNVRPHLLSPTNNLSEWWIAPADRRYRQEQ